MFVKMDGRMVETSHGLARTAASFPRVFLKSRALLQFPLQSKKIFKTLTELPNLR